MNKRIQELLQQCTYQIPGIGEEFNHNRFVKLIYVESSDSDTIILSKHHFNIERKSIV